MPRTACAKRDVRISGMRIEDEMLVRRHRVETGAREKQVAIAAGDVAAHEGTRCIGSALQRLTIHHVYIRDRRPSMHPNFEAGTVHAWQAIRPHTEFSGHMRDKYRK